MIEIRRSADRGITRTSWLESRHSFSYGAYYDPDNVGFGSLIAVNEDRLQPGTGFDTHRHRDLEIVTWVVSGALEHEDSAGHRQVLQPGCVQRLSAGAGVAHSERAAGSEPVHYVQMWVGPDHQGLRPDYVRVDATERLRSGDLVALVSGRAGADAPIRIDCAAAEFAVARPAAGAGFDVPPGRLVHLHVVAGSVTLEGAGSLAVGDTVRITRGDGPRATADGPAEVLLWSFD